ncbi:GTP 3',8-cyclase MoaA, partial [bacterium]
LSPRQEILSFEEIARIARVGATLGLTKIRLTGGEPTVRRNLPELIALLRAIPEIREIAMTTNAALLGEMAAPLKAAGLDRLNVSLDTLESAKAAEIARRDYFDRVLAGIEASQKVGLGLKFNTVVMRGLNENELPDLLTFAHSYGAQIRFIEYMPMGMARFDERNRLVTAEEMREILASKFDLVPETGNESDPARGYVCQKTGARAGFITSMSNHFCETCNRMRLTSTGGLRPCLHQNAEVDARVVLRSGGSDEDLRLAFLEAAGMKWAGHHMNDVIPLFSSKEMVSIGG